VGTSFVLAQKHSYSIAKRKLSSNNHVLLNAPHRIPVSVNRICHIYMLGKYDFDIYDQQQQDKSYFSVTNIDISIPNYQNKKNFSLFCNNVQSVNSFKKFEDFNAFIHKFNVIFDIIILTETWY